MYKADSIIYSLPFGMEPAEAIGLIKAGVSATGIQRWADLGCGAGMFTRSLAGILPATSQIIAVDKDRQRFPGSINNVSIEFTRSDFVNDQPVFAGLDGILMANSLHYVKDKVALLKKLESCFRAERRFIIVEYESRRSNAWVPYPIHYQQLADLAVQLGYSIQKIGDLPSRFGGSMYSALLLHKHVSS